MSKTDKTNESLFEQLFRISLVDMVAICYSIIIDLALLIELARTIYFVLNIPLGNRFSHQSLSASLAGLATLFLISMFISWMQNNERYIPSFPKLSLLKLYPRLVYISRRIYYFHIYSSLEYKVLSSLCAQTWCDENFVFALVRNIKDYHQNKLRRPQTSADILQDIYFALRVMRHCCPYFFLIKEYIIGLEIPIPDPIPDPIAHESFRNSHFAKLGCERFTNCCPLGIVCETMTGFSPETCPNQLTCRKSLL